MKIGREDKEKTMGRHIEREERQERLTGGRGTKRPKAVRGERKEMERQ